MTNPLSRVDLQNASKHIFELTANQERIDKLEKTGANVDELRARNEHALGVLRAIVAEYGGPRG